MHVHDEEAWRHPVGKGLAPAGTERHTGISGLQRELLDLQRSAGNAAVAGAIEEQQPSPVLDVVGRGGGASLPPPVRDDMESRFGADFSGVRVHTGEQAASSASSVQAQAYTVGDEIVLGAGREDLTSDAGQHTLAHELTHVLQQREGAVDGTPTGGGIQVSDPSDRFEQAAEANATSVLAAPAASPAPSGTAQRQVAPEPEEEEEKEPVQTSAVQRIEAEEEQPEEPAA